MADVVNLNRFRKAKARTERAAEAATNRVLFGRTKSEREQAHAEAELAGRRLDGHVRGPARTTDGEEAP